jgi:hypothetical protein
MPPLPKKKEKKAHESRDIEDAVEVKGKKRLKTV